jgi:signal transduction histidine kinase
MKFWVLPTAQSDNPRLRRVFRVLAVSMLVSLLVFFMAPVLALLDAGSFKEIMHGFAELLPSLPFPDFKNMQTGSSIAGGSLLPDIFSSSGASHILGLILFASGAAWASYKFAGAGRIVFLLQLLVLSLVYQVLVWHFARATGHPASIVVAILGSCLVGRLLKSRDDERRQFEARQIELKLRNEELQESRLALVRQDESERRLLAADLHDQVLNDLRTIQKKFGQYVASPEPEARDKIDSLFKQVMTDIREIMDELCPVMLEEFGLAAAIEDRLDKAAQLGGFNVRFSQTVEGSELDDLAPVQKLLLYRLVQESLTNVCKHAAASLVRVSIVCQDSQLIFSVTDNGKGIDASRLSESSRGTLYMRLRAALIGAKVSWKQGPDGKGTTVEIRLHVQDSGS